MFFIFLQKWWCWTVLFSCLLSWRMVKSHTHTELDESHSITHTGYKLIKLSLNSFNLLLLLLLLGGRFGVVCKHLHLLIAFLSLLNRPNCQNYIQNCIQSSSKIHSKLHPNNKSIFKCGIPSTSITSTQLCMDGGVKHELCVI